MDQSTGPKIMVFRPVMDDFKDFNRYMESIEMLGAQKAGVCKIIPPKEWRPRRESYNNIDMTIPSPIEQVVQGSKGIYTQFNMQKRAISVADFRRLANSVRYAPPASVLHAGDDFETVERVYWKNITFNAPMYGADVSGSLTDEDQPYWNINQLGSILDTVYNDYRVKIEGVNTAYLYFGMWKASFAWHTEDLDLYSINYLHFGEPKSWYAIPPEAGRRVERLAASYFPESARQCPAFLRHKMTLISPTVLRSNGIPFQHMTQRAGEIMITFPYGYHAGFNHGLNCAESTNFALPRWVEYGKRCSICRCRKDSVRINMDVFVKKYQPDRYEDWLAGRDVGPHPEDDQVWAARRTASAKAAGAGSLHVDTACASSLTSPPSSSSTKSKLDAIFDKVVGDNDEQQSAPGTSASRKRVVNKRHPPFSEIKSQHDVCVKTKRKVKAKRAKANQSHSNSSSDYSSDSDSDSDSQSEQESDTSSDSEPSNINPAAPTGAVIGSRSMAFLPPPSASPSKNDAQLANTESKPVLDAQVAISPAFIGLAPDTLEHFVTDWPSWAASLWTVPDERAKARSDIERAKRISMSEYTEQRTNRLLSNTAPHCAVCSLFWTLQTRYEVLSKLTDAKADADCVTLPPRSTVLISEAVFGRHTLAKPSRGRNTAPSASPSPSKSRSSATDVCDLLVCDMCNVVVHSSCYGHFVSSSSLFDSPTRANADADASSSKWLCRRCRAAEKQRVSFSDLTCALCCMRFGALKPTADGRWAHIVCALGNDLPFGDLLRREPILLTPANAPVRRRAKSGSKRDSNAGRNETDQASDGDHAAPQRSRTRCAYCSHMKAPTSTGSSSTASVHEHEFESAASFDTGAASSGPLGYRSSVASVSASSCMEEEETVLDFTAGKRSMAGKCAQCYIIKPRQCPATFHVTCGWLAGVAFEMLDWPVLFSTVCYKHVLCIARETTGKSQGDEEIELGLTVIAKNPAFNRYEHCKVHGKSSKSFCDLDFLDGQYSSDTLPEFIESHNVARDGAPSAGTIVQVRWTDGLLYKAKFLGLNQQTIYEVEFEDGDVRSANRDEIYTLDQPLPRKVKNKLKLAPS